MIYVRVRVSVIYVALFARFHCALKDAYGWGTGNSKTPMPVLTLSSAALSRGYDGDQDGARGLRTAITSGQADGLAITQHENRHEFTECALLVINLPSVCGPSSSAGKLAMRAACAGIECFEQQSAEGRSSCITKELQLKLQSLVSCLPQLPAGEGPLSAGAAARNANFFCHSLSVQTELQRVVGSTGLVGLPG